MDIRIKWIAIISIILLISVAAVAQPQDSNMDGKGPENVNSEEKKQNNDNGKQDTSQKPQDAGKPTKDTDQTEKGTNSDKGKENELTDKDKDKGNEDQAGKTVRERVEQKIKEKIDEHVQKENKGKGQSNKVKESVKEKLEERIHHARNSSENAKKQYAEARQKYSETKQKGNPDLQQAQLMMRSGTGYMSAWLDRIELQVLHASNMDDSRRLAILEKIDEYNNQTGEKREMINNTTSIQDLRELGKGLNDYWSEVQIFIKSVGYQIAVAKMDNIIGDARGLEVRIAEKIAEMNATDTDTSKLENLLNEYQEKINAAKKNLEEAQDVLFNATTVEDVVRGSNMVKEATNQIKQAFNNIQLMANEYQKEWEFFGNETGEVFATGDGEATVNVSGIVVAKGNGSINVYEGSLTTVTDLGEKISGNGSRITDKEVYVVRGENVSIEVSGKGIYLFAKGQGSVNLTGNWNYRIKESQSEMVVNETIGETISLSFGGQ